MGKTNLITYHIVLLIFTIIIIISDNGQGYKFSHTSKVRRQIGTEIEPNFISEVEGINNPGRDSNALLRRVIRSPHDENIDADEDSEIDETTDHEGGESSGREKEIDSTSTTKNIIHDSGTDSTTKVSEDSSSEPNATTNSINKTLKSKQGQFLLPEGYNKLIIPKLECNTKAEEQEYAEFCNTFPVVFHMEIIRIQDINEDLETLTLDLDLRLRWVDGFVKDHHTNSDYHLLNLDPIFLNQIWIPDIFIDEMVHVKRTSMLNKPLKIEFSPASGYISYKTRLRVQLGCEMTYEHYPADTQRCEFNIRSYSHTSDELHLRWLDKGVYLRDPSDPNFDIQVSSTEVDQLQQQGWDDQTHSFNLLKFTILARRKISFHMVQTYLPSVFFIAITWLCFLVPSDMVEARIGVSMTTLLTLTSMFDSVREHSPHVSYVKAIDIWMVSCIFFIFLTLLEFITVMWLRRRRKVVEEKRPKLQRHRQEKQPDDEFKDAGRRLSKVEITQLRRYEKVAEFTEKYAFIIFSAGFIVFNVFYWTWLLTASDYLSWTMNKTLNHLDVDN